MIGETAVPADLEPEHGEKSRGDFIFVKPDLFTSLFSSLDRDNKRQVPSSPDTSQYKYLSRVRKINTTGIGGIGICWR